MSWSIVFTGTPDEIVAALDDHSNKITGQSKVEYDAAKPHMSALVAENFAAEGSGYNPPTLILEASGHGSSRDGEQLARFVSVRLAQHYVAKPAPTPLTE